MNMEVDSSACFYKEIKHYVTSAGSSKQLNRKAKTTFEKSTAFKRPSKNIGIYVYFYA